MEREENEERKGEENMRMTSRSPAPFFYQQGKRGILLVHGFTGSTAEMGPMGEFFADQGWTVHAPLLAGHGTTPEELGATSWEDWLCSAEEGIKVLQKAGCTQLFAAGHSMGGLLVLQLAQRYPLQAIATLSTPMVVQDRFFPFVGFLKHFKTNHERRSRKPSHIEEKIIPYPYTPLESIDQLRRLLRDTRRSIKKVTTPIFIAQSGRDETVQPQSGALLYEKVGSIHKELKIYPKSSHIITLDHERKQLFQDVLQFFVAHS